jgi:rhodanese-related sulfurtransferase
MKMIRLAITAAMLMLLTSGAAWAIDPASVPERKQTKAKLYLGAGEVPAFLDARKGKVLFLDVRTPAEMMFAGNTPLIDANVPFKLGPTNTFNEKRSAFTLVINPDFVAQAEKRLAAKSLTKDDAVVLMCRSGGRSATAANVLTDAGFKKVYSVTDGFEGDTAKDGPDAGHRVLNGWKNKGLPWGYKLDKAKMTLE